MANIYDVNAAIEKPNLFGTAAAGMKFGNEQRALREQRADEATIRQLSPAAIGGDFDAQEKIAALDPTRAAGLRKAGEARWETIKGGVQLVKQAQASGKPENVQRAWASVRPYFAKAQGVDLSLIPEDFATAAPHFDGLVAKLASIEGGTAEAKPDYDRYRNVGGTLIDLAGDPTKPIFTAPDDPVNAALVDVPDGKGGTMKMVWDPQTRQLADLPTPGGMPAPTTGAGAEVMGGALQNAQGGQPFFDDVQAAIAPFGGILGSTTGGQHNVGSLHYGGNAVDIPMGASASPEAKANAAQMIAALEAKGYRVRDERTRPAGQAVWSGPHLHAERVSGAAPQTGRLGYTPPKTGAQWQPLGPEEVAAVGLPAGTVAQRNTETGQIQTVRLPPVPPTGAATASEDERKAAGWVNQARFAADNMAKALEADKGADEPGFIETYSPFDEVANWSRSDARQQYVQAASSFSEAVLRAATGAGVNKDEALQKVRELTPQRQDGPGVREQKRLALDVYLRSLEQRAGRALQPPATPPPVAGSGGGGQSARPQRATNPQTGEVIVLVNGQWVPE